jgi:hypothetical protein
MPIDTNFSFAHRRTGPAATAVAAAEPADLLGLLRGFVGTAPAGKDAQRIWKGPGFNMIWRPNFGSESGTKKHFLQLNFTEETLTFTDITGTGIANRGLLQTQIFLGGVAYLQTINDSFDNTGQHFEPGVWANVPATTNPAEQATVVRMGSIPHGTTVNMQGRAFAVTTPQFEKSSIVPFRIGSPDDGQTNLVPFPDEQDLSRTTDARTDLTRVAALDQAHLDDPNLFLSDAIAGQTITNTVVLVVSSDVKFPPPPPPNVPDVGGGAADIAFLIGKGAPPAGGPNANAVRATSTFWIETVKDQYGKEFMQLQYTQRVLLDFSGLSWPHVTVATLRLV